jgi:hypothetical protein
MTSSRVRSPAATLAPSLARAVERVGAALLPARCQHPITNRHPTGTDGQTDDSTE